MKNALMTLVLSHAVVLCGCSYGLKFSVTKVHYKPVTPGDQMRTAYHEGSHAVVSAALKTRDPLSDIVVHTEISKNGEHGTSEYDDDFARLDTAEDVMNEAVEYLAGREAEEAVLGRMSNAGDDDLHHANKLFEDMCTVSGLCGSLLVEKTPSPESLAKIKRCLNLSQARARVLVEANLETIKRLAELIMAQPISGRKRTLSGEQFRAFLKGRTLVTEAMAGYQPATTCP